MIGRRVLATCAILLAAGIAAGADEAKPESTSPYAQWKNGPSKDDSYFPIAVWCQEPGMAPEYQKAGINLYFALWEGPTEAQLAELKKDGMQVVCAQNAVGLAHIDDPTIVGWMHGDEPDNAQSGGAPVPPAKIVEEYEAIRKADPSRPVFINFGRGVAWDGWKGRGTRNNEAEAARRAWWEWLRHPVFESCWGSCNYLSCENWLKVGGWDERTFGWGGDDDVLHNRIPRTGVKQIKIDGLPLMHIEHPLRDWHSKSARGFENVAFVHQVQENYLRMGASGR